MNIFLMNDLVFWLIFLELGAQMPQKMMVDIK